MRFNFYYNTVNENTDSKVFRISQTSQSFRNNQYNEYKGTFEPRPSVATISVNKQKICTTFNIGKKTLNNCDIHAPN
jgi:hypothetical protein